MFNFKYVSSTILCFLLLISFGVPLELIRFRLGELEQKNYLWREAALKEAAYQEMAGFKNDLKPENYIDFAIRSSEKKYAQKMAMHQFIPNGEDYLTFLEKELRLEYGLKPLFISWAGDYCRKTRVFISTDFNIDPVCRQEFIEFVNRFSLYDIRDYYSFKDDKQIVAMIDNWIREAIAKGFSDVGEHLKSLYRKFISVYYAIRPPPNQAYRFFVDRYNFQFLFYYPRLTVVDGNFTGLVNVAILEKDIDLAILQKQSRRVVRSHLYQVERQLFRQTDSFSGKAFDHSENKIVLEDSIPIELLILQRNQKRLFPKLNGKNYEDKLFSGIRIELVRLFEDDLASYDRLLATMMRILLLALFILWVKIALFGFSFKMELRRKFVLLMAIVLFPPAFMSSFLSEMIARKERELLLGVAKNKLTVGLDRLENLLIEAKNRQSFNNIAIKELFTNFVQKNSPDRLNLKKMEPLFKYNGDSCLIYKNDGSLISFADFRIPNDPDQLEVGNSAKFLASLGAIKNNDPDVIRHLRRSELADGVVSGFFELLDEALIMAQEGLIKPRLVKTSPIFLSQDFLLPDLDSESLKPKAAVILSQKLKDSYFEILKNSEGFPHKLLSDINSVFELHLAVAERDSAEFEQLKFCGDPRSVNYFTEVLRKAALQGSSGSSMVTVGEKTELLDWRIFQDSPIMLAGRCQINSAADAKSLISLLPLAVFAFSLLSLLVLAEVVSSLFLPPISALNSAATRIIEKADFRVKLNIENNDEFDYMGAAFNDMTVGLLQRQHLSRFVSGRLLENLSASENDHDNLSEEVEVTVLCSDLRNFTTISSNFPAETVVETLNEYFTEMEPAIVGNGGVIDKFIGDAIVAVFYQDRCQNTALAAVRAAQDMRRILFSLNSRREADGKFSLENGVGIASGSAISGNLGLVGVHMDFSITGKVLRLANDLEALSKIAEISRVVIDEASSRKIEEFFLLQPLKVEGLKCWQLVGERKAEA